MADFLHDSWYCAGWAHEIDERAKGIRILGEYLVLYRGAEGQAIAMTGRCPHRFAPLDRGVVAGDTIMCPYHGLQFNSEGACVLNPHGDGFIPPQARLRAYPAAERNRALWVWMGDPSNADLGLLPPETKLSSGDYASEYAYLHVGANYQLVIDNLLDLSHAPFLHAATLAAEAPLSELRHEFSTEGETVHSNYFMASAPPSPQMETLFPDPVGSFSAHMTWRPASILQLDIWQRPLPGGSAEALNLPSVHYITPETDGTTHYFAAMSRNLKTGSSEEDERMRSIMVRAFTEEDEPMVRACQDLMGTTDLFALSPAILKTDVAAIQARRILKRRLSTTQAARPAAAPA